MIFDFITSFHAAQIPSADLENLIGMSHSEFYSLSAEYARPFVRPGMPGFRQRYEKQMSHFILIPHFTIYQYRPLRQLTPDALMLLLILKVKEGFSDKVETLC